MENMNKLQSIELARKIAAEYAAMGEPLPRQDCPNCNPAARCNSHG